MTDSARRVALAVLKDVRRNNEFTSNALDAALTHKVLSQQDAALTTELVYGVLRNRLYLDFIIAEFSSQPLKKIEPLVMDALRLGAYQLLLLDRIPDHAAVSESVNLVQKRAKGFVNALLKKIASLDEPPQVRGADFIERLSIETSHPSWIVETFVKRFGDDGAQKLCRANQHPPINVLRVNTLRISRDELVEKLKGQGIHASQAKYAPDALIVDRLDAVLKPKVYDQGLFMVQGEASQLVVELLDPQPGEKVLDACAAPGGKSTHIAARVGPDGRVIACDIARGRLTRVSENATLLGLENVTTVVADMTRKPPGRIGKNFDRVLVDTPCSALGDLQKHPDARYRKTPESVESLVGIQQILIERGASLTKPGGVLVYSTCTLTAEENEGVVEPFLRRHPDFELEKAGEVLGAGRESFGTDQGYFLAAPHRTGTGGFFAARMTRKKYM